MKLENFINVEWLILLIVIIFAGSVVFLNLPLQEENTSSISNTPTQTQLGSPKVETDNLTKVSEEPIRKEEKKEILPGPLEVKENNVLVENLLSSKIIYFTNIERKKAGIKTLSENIFLDEAAKQKNLDMVKNQYFDHISPEGLSVSYFVEKVNYQYLNLGENLALGNFSNENEVVKAWMASPGHRANILDSKFKEIGVNVQKAFFNGRETFLIVQIFARPLSDCPVPDSNLSLSIENQRKEINALQEKINNLKIEIENLQKEWNQIYQEGMAKIQEGTNLIKQGNDLIEQGDRIYNETLNKEEAEKYWTNGEKLQKEGQDIIIKTSDEYNQKLNQNYSLTNKKINEYNALVNNLQNILSEFNKNLKNYNQQVNEFNQCVSQ